MRTITGCTLDTNTQHLHSETKIIPLQNHLKLHASQLIQKASHPTHPLHPLTRQEAHPRYKKQSTFNNNINYTLNIPSSTQTTSHTQIKNYMKTIHTKIVHDSISSTHNKIFSKQPPPIHESEITLDHHTRRTLAQLRSNKSPFILSYLNKSSPSSHPSPLCPLPNTPSRHPSPLHLLQNKYHTRPRESVDRPRESGWASWPLDGLDGNMRSTQQD